jgi:hypothetical protein
MVRAAVEHNCVLAIRIYLNNRMTSRLVDDTHKSGIDPLGFQSFEKPIAVAPDSPDMHNVDTGARQGNGLIKPFTASEDPVTIAANRLAGPHEMIDLVNMVDVDRTEIDDSGHVWLLGLHRKGEIVRTIFLDRRLQFTVEVIAHRERFDFVGNLRSAHLDRWT